METRVTDQKSYKIHTIKTSKYKTTKIIVVFRGEATIDNYIDKILLSGMFNEGSKKYPNSRSLSIAIEELYSPLYDIYTRKIGEVQSLFFSMNFINPEFIEEKNYLANIISFLFNSILKPNVTNNEFDNDNFNLVKKNILYDIESTEENIDSKSILSLFNDEYKDSATGLNILTVKSKIDKITPSSLYKSYLDIINNDLVDIFVIGNTNMENIENEIKNHYKNHHIRNKKLNYYVENKVNKVPKIIQKQGKFIESNLICVYNLKDLTLDEKEVAFSVFNYIFGNGSLSSKLYTYIREQNSYCYHIDSSYYKYDNLLLVSASLEYKNIEHTIKLINKSLIEMQKGIFTDEEFENAKKNIISRFKINQDYPVYILQNYMYNNFIGTFDIETKIQKFTEITKKDVINVAKKIKLNLTYVIQEEK